METGMSTPPFDDSSSRHQSVSRKSPSSSTASLATRAAKSGNGSGSHTAGSSSGHSHHHNSHRASKRSATTPSTSHSHHSSTAHSHSSPHHDSSDGRHKRVWKACERCRMKKTKCDGEFPCKRCKDDGLVCTAGTRKKTEYKQLPKGYAEVLENTQFALVATVHKLYAMVRAANAWDLGEPELNERGQPVIHSIAAKLGCIRPNNDPDLPMGSSVFPEDEADLAELAVQLEEQQKHREAEQAVQAAQTQAAQVQIQAQSAAIPIVVPASAPAAVMTGGNNGIDLSQLNRFDRASSSEELDNFSDMDDYRRNVFGGGANGGSSVHSGSTTMSPQSLTYNDFDVVSTQSETFSVPSPTVPAQFSNWVGRSASLDLTPQQQQQVQVQAVQAQTQAQTQTQQIQGQSRQQQQQQQQQRQIQQHRLQQQQQQQQRQRQKRQHNSSTQSPLSLSVPTPISTASMPIVASPTSYFAVDLLRQGLVESNFGTIKPHVLSCPNPEVMLGMGDPMIYSGGYDDVLM